MKFCLSFFQSKIQHYLIVIFFCLISFSFFSFPVNAAEAIYFNYGFINFSVALADLEAYAKERIVSSRLGFYLNFLSPEEQAKFYQFLQLRLDLNDVKVSRFLQAPMGQILLNFLASIIQENQVSNPNFNLNYYPNSNSHNVLAEAIVKATLDHEGLTIINVLDNLPDDIRINAKAILGLKQQIYNAIQDTNKLLNTIEKTNPEAISSQSNSTLKTLNSLESVLDFSSLPDLRQLGEINVTKEVWPLQDQSRDRDFIAHVYLPSSLLIEAKETPLIIISPGLGSTLEIWNSLCQHFASYGFAVAVIQHPGSDFQRIQSFFDGFNNQTWNLEEFLHRPQDITYFLDELEKENKSRFNNQLNVNKVGILGQSFGAYTGLVLAGSRLNFDQLKKDCLPQIKSPNLSLLLQCRGLELPQENYDFHDERIAALFLIDPITGSILGNNLRHVKLPILWKSSSNDIVTPVILEQILSFNWLSTSDKHLVLVKGANHSGLNFKFFQENSGSDNNNLDNNYTEEKSPEIENETTIVETYLKTLGVAFFQKYLANDSNYEAYLQQSYTKIISIDNYPLSIVSPISKLVYD